MIRQKLIELLEAIKNKYLCCHNWKIWSTVDVETDFGGSFTRYFLVCTKCGKLKKVRTNHG